MIKEKIFLNYNNENYQVEINFKKIKHFYLKIIDENHLRVNCSNLLSIKEVEKLVLINLPKLLNKVSSVKTFSPYYLWGEEKDPVYFKSKLNNSNNQKSLEKFYINQTRDRIEKLEPEINQVISQLGIKPLPIVIKVLKSKYGSINFNKNYITINAKLALLEPNYLKYVLYHEYAHVIVRNHSKNFYNTVGKLMPDYKKYHQNLNKFKLSLKVNN